MQKPIIEDKIHLEVDKDSIFISFGMAVADNRLLWQADKLVAQIYLSEHILLPKPITHSLLDEIGYTDTSSSSGGVQTSVNFLFGQAGAGSELSKGFEISHPAIEWTPHQNSQNNEKYYRFAIPSSAIKVVGNDNALIFLHWSQSIDSYKIKEIRIEIGQENTKGFEALYRKKWEKSEQIKLQAAKSTGNTKLFISYARKDARELALRLQADLQRDGFEVWLDTSEIEGGASWSTEIENAIEDCTTALALLSAGSYVSEICRAEQLRCLRKGKQVVPLMVQADAERPIHLEHLNYRDFTSSSSYKSSFELLLGDIRDMKVAVSNGKVKETYTNAPALPLNFVERPEERDKLRQELIADDGERRIALTALQGMGGIGKSALAAWICRDEIVQAAFPDGVIWVDVGRENVNLLELIKLVGTKLGDAMGHYSSEVAALSRLRETLPSKSALIVLDDVWQSEHAKAFSEIEAPRSRVLFTTRNESIGKGLGASLVKVGVMKPQQALELLREWAGHDLPEMPEIAKKLGYLPLGLKIAGSRLSEMSGKEWLETFKSVSKTKLGRNAKTRDENLEVCLDLSVSLLTEDDQLFYHGLGIFPEDIWIPETAAFKLWQAYEPSLSAADCREIARDLHKLALVERRENDGAMLLHDILHDYNYNRMKERNEYKNAHQKLLQRYNPDEKQAWWEIEPDGYIYENLAYHLIELEHRDYLHKLLTTSPAWMEAKYIHSMGDSAYVADIALAMKPYKDPLSPEKLMECVELNMVRQVVNTRVGSYNDDLLRALFYLKREKEALNHARLRPNLKEQFDGLFTIWKIAQEKERDLGIQSEELVQVALSISSASQQARALRELADSFAQAQHPKTNEVFSFAQQAALRIPEAREQAEALRQLATSLAQAQQFEQAQQVALSISSASQQARALGQLATSLAQAQQFEQAQQVALSIQEVREQEWALCELAGSLAQAQQFEQAQQVALSIPEAREQAEALRQLSTSLAQAQHPKANEVFSLAQQAALSIFSASQRAWALRKLANSLTQAQHPKTDEVFSLAQQAALSISAASQQATALGELAVSLAQAQHPKTNEVFSLAQQAALSIPAASQQATALGELAVSLAQAQHPKTNEVFSLAQQVALSIPAASQQATALRQLADSLAQAQRFEQAQQVALSIPESSEQMKALSSLAVSLAQAQHPKTNEVFSLARQVALSIPATYQQATALRQLSTSLAQAHQFEQAQQVALRIPEVSEQAEALRELAVSLAQAQHPKTNEVFSLAQQAALSIPAASQQATALRQLSTSLAQAQHPKANEVFSLAQQAALRIPVASQQATALRELAVSLVQAQRFEQAQQVALSIQEVSEQAWALRELAVSLAQAQQFEQAQQVALSIQEVRPQAWALRELANSLAQAQRFEQAQQVALSIPEVRSQAWALHELANSLAQAQRFEQAQQVALSIPEVSEQAEALRKLANSLAQAQRFEQAQQAALGIPAASQQATALRELADSLVQAQHPKINEVFSLAQQAALGIPAASQQATALRELADSLVQAQHPKINEVFSLAQQAALSISAASQQATALRELADSLVQAQHPKINEVFSLAQQVALSIPEVSEQAEALRELADSLVQAQHPKINEVFSLAQQVALSIPEVSEQAEALRELADSLVQAQHPKINEVFSLAQQVALSIPEVWEQTTALRELADSLAQAQRFEQAQQVTLSILEVSEQAEALHELADSLAQAQRFEQAQQVALSIPEVSEQAEALRELADSLAQAQRFEQAQQVALSIPEVSEQAEVLCDLANRVAYAQLYHKSLIIFGMQTIEETISLLSRWQKVFEEHFTDEKELWQRIMLAAFEIICWYRKDYEPIRDILRGK